MKTIRELLTTAETKAQDMNKEASAVKLLMLHATKKDGAALLVDLDSPLPQEQQENFEQNVDAYLLNNVPVQHLIGHETFFGYEFKVNEHVLIPRFETEELVAKVLELYDTYFDGILVDVVDVGTGSGAIGISLALEEPNMNMTITDISADALTVAKENAETLGAKVKILESDMLKGLVASGDKFDILVSNPPYIPEKEDVESLVYDNEPHLALFGGADGLYFYREILRDAHQILKFPNLIAFEHAYHHREGMAQLIGEYFPAATFETIKDMQGRDRMTVIVNK